MKVKPAKQRRNRAILSCISCRIRKRKCDRKYPCGQCTQRGQAQFCKRLPASDPIASLASLTQSRIQRNEHASGTESENEEETDGQNGKSTEDATDFYTRYSGLTIYTEARGDSLVDNILAMHKDSISGCSCAIENKRCMLHSTATGLFLSSLSESSESYNPDPKERGQSRSIDLGHEWTPRKSLLIPKITDANDIMSLKNAYESLPSLFVLQNIIDVYYDELDWLWILTPREIFLPCLKAFKELVLDPTVSYTQIDPAFVAQLLIMCAMACFVLESPAKVLGYDVSPEQWDRFISVLYHNSTALMKVAKWVSRPTLRSIWAALHITDFLALYLEKDADVRIMHVTMAYQQCFALQFQSESFEQDFLRVIPQDPALPKSNLLLNREIRRRLLLGAYIQYWSESFSGWTVRGVGVPSIPLPINCNTGDLMRQEFDQMKDLSSLSVSLLQRPLHEPTYEFLDLSLYCHLHAAQSAHADQQRQKRTSSTMEHLNRLEKQLVHLIGLTQSIPGLDPFADNIDYNEAISRFLDLRPEDAEPSQYSVMTSFCLCLTTESIYNLHRGLFESHLRTGKDPGSAIKVIKASRQLLSYERVFKGNGALRNVAHICNLQRAILTLFIGLLLSMTDKARPDTLYRLSQNSEKVSVQDILHPNDLRNDVGILREAASSIEVCTLLPGKMGAKRASLASSTLSLLWYVVHCIETRLREIDPDYVVDAAAGPSEPMPLISLDELLALSDDLIDSTTNDLDNMGFFTNMKMMGFDLNPDSRFQN